VERIIGVVDYPFHTNLYFNQAIIVLRTVINLTVLPVFPAQSNMCLCCILCWFFRSFMDCGK